MIGICIGKYFIQSTSSGYSGIFRQLFFSFRLRLWSVWRRERRSITRTTPGGSQRSSVNITPTSSGLSSLTSALSSWVRDETCSAPQTQTYISSHDVTFTITFGQFALVFLSGTVAKNFFTKSKLPIPELSHIWWWENLLKHAMNCSFAFAFSHFCIILVRCPSGSWATLTRTALSLSQSSALPSIWSWPGKMVTSFLKFSPPRWDRASWSQVWLQRHRLRYAI